MKFIFDAFEKYVLPVYALLVIVALTLFLFVLLPVYVYLALTDSTRSTITLDKDEWTCTRLNEHASSTAVKAGRIIAPQPITRHDCEQWSRK